jgi:hypothetical protein
MHRLRSQQDPPQQIRSPSQPPAHTSLPSVQAPASQRSPLSQIRSHRPQWKRLVVTSTHSTSTPFEQHTDVGPPSHGARVVPHTQRPPSHRSDTRTSQASPHAPQSVASRSRFAQYAGEPGLRPSQHHDCRFPVHPRSVEPHVHWLALQRSPRWLETQSISHKPQCRGSARRLAHTADPVVSTQQVSTSPHIGEHADPASTPESRPPSCVRPESARGPEPPSTAPPPPHPMRTTPNNSAGRTARDHDTLPPGSHVAGTRRLRVADMSGGRAA